MNEIVVGVFTVIGVGLGAFLTYLFSKRSEFEKHLKQLETQAYVDFIKAVAGISSAQREKDTKKQIEHELLMSDAKARICIYGKSEVIMSIASFWRKGAGLSEEGSRNFLEVIKSLRKASTPGNKELTKEDMNQLLFGRD